MKRYAMRRLQEWKEDPSRLPMIIRGARQVGKTWLMREFGRTAFEKCAYINFDRNERMQHLFSGDFDVDRILRGLSIESGVEIEPENTLIILDEIQEVRRPCKASNISAKTSAIATISLRPVLCLESPCTKELPFR